MSTLNTNIPTLLDVTRTIAPDGTHFAIAEVLHETNEVLNDIPFIQGNLVTGMRDAYRSSLPSVGWRRLNEGVAVSKSTTSTIDEAAALLEANSQVDRKVAILGGNAAQYRANEATAFIEAMGQEFTSKLFYGNSQTDPATFTGFAPRYNDLDDPQVISGSGSGLDNRSIWLIDWGENSVRGIYPKATTAGLMHMDTTANKAQAGDGYPIGDRLYDSLNRPYQGYTDHYEWNVGLGVKDRRKVVRICNIDMSDLVKTAATGADLQDLLIQAVNRLQTPTSNARIYMPRLLFSWFERQMVNTKNGYLSWSEIGGSPILRFRGIPMRRVDALDTDEAAVTT